MLQPLPPPEIHFPTEWHRTQIQEFFVAFQFRAIWFFYGAYLVGLSFLWARSLLRREPFRHGLLLATTILGAVFFIRSTGRSDEPHLDSVIPPVCLLVAHALSLAFGSVWRERGPDLRRHIAASAACALALATWVYLLATDLVAFPRAKGMQPLTSISEHVVVRPTAKARAIDRTVDLIREVTRPDDIILNMGPTPLFHVLTGRTGPGHLDTIMLGTFLKPRDEIQFIERLKHDPPAAVIWPTRDFDDMQERSLSSVAPRVSKWVWQNYVPLPKQQRWIVMIPREKAPRGGG
jgi:hypothetical protein